MDKKQWITDLRAEAMKAAMKDRFWLSRDQVFELIWDDSTLASRPADAAVAERGEVVVLCTRITRGDFQTQWVDGPLTPDDVSKLKHVGFEVQLAYASPPAKPADDDTCWTCGNPKHEGSVCTDPKWATAAMCDKLLARAIKAETIKPVARVDVAEIVDRLKDRVFPNHECPTESAAVWNVALYEMQRLLDSTGAADGAQGGRVDEALETLRDLNDVAFPPPDATPAELALFRKATDRADELLQQVALAQPKNETQAPPR